ncbi:MAG: DUF58 domain-containing protein [Planctomycetes bacterium]|nr:DUF58 domain-containing protein [Planctomycetota bacterium]
MADDDAALLSGEFLRSLARLDLASKKIVRGGATGERRSRKKGASVEFADHKPYSPGDDLRFIDWNVYGRLDRVFVKLFLEEEDRLIHVLLDASGSMRYGAPDKHLFARRAAAALAFLALSHGDRVGVAAFSTSVDRAFPPVRGKPSLSRLLRFLEDLPAAGGTAINAACRKFALGTPRRSLVILLSDFLDPAGYEPGLADLATRHCDAAVIQVLAPEEDNPTLAGDLRLVDLEEGARVDVSLSAPLLRAYRRRLDALRAGLAAFCRRRGIALATVRTDMPLHDLVFGSLRKAGLVV